MRESRKIVELVFIITQHSRDKFLMGSFVDYLGCGRLSVSKNAAYYTCSKFSDISEKILAFFSKYEILGVKSEDFKNFCKALEIVKSKNHLILPCSTSTS
jgi:hypothetical protein